MTEAMTPSPDRAPLSNEDAALIQSAKTWLKTACFYGPNWRRVLDLAAGTLPELQSLRTSSAALQAEVERLTRALEYIAEEHDAGRHDGLPEACPAHDDRMMWIAAQQALKGATFLDDEAELASRPSPLAYDLICQTDAILHEMCNEGTEDERWHAEQAHSLIHDAAAHLSPEASIRAIARKEATERPPPVTMPEQRVSDDNVNRMCCDTLEEWQVEYRSQAARDLRDCRTALRQPQHGYVEGLEYACRAADLDSKIREIVDLRNLYRKLFNASRPASAIDEVLSILTRDAAPSPDPVAKARAEEPDDVLPGLLVTAAQQLDIASDEPGHAHYRCTATNLRNHADRLKRARSDQDGAQR